ncbi:hypothetical protein MSKOL_0731 [Methanosarcina sp. Kolksee]|nr:hypothetical protein MSKOL_0731 [Methanosarcina sp. Kolksee]
MLMVFNNLHPRPKIESGKIRALYRKSSEIRKNEHIDKLMEEQQKKKVIWSRLFILHTNEENKKQAD